MESIADGVHSILFENGERTQLERKFIFGDFVTLDESVNTTPQGARKIAPGTPVNAKYGGTGEWFSGKIAFANVDGTYDIAYDDGDSEQQLGSEHVRETSAASTVGPGAAVECRYGQTPKFYPGRISSADADGTFSVAYDDGEREEGVVRRRVRLPGQRQRATLAQGDQVDARSDSGKVVSLFFLRMSLNAS